MKNQLLFALSTLVVGFSAHAADEKTGTLETYFNCTNGACTVKFDVDSKGELKAVDGTRFASTENSDKESIEAKLTENQLKTAETNVKSKILSIEETIGIKLIAQAVKKLQEKECQGLDLRFRLHRSEQPGQSVNPDEDVSVSLLFFLESDRASNNMKYLNHMEDNLNAIKKYALSKDPKTGAPTISEGDIESTTSDLREYCLAKKAKAFKPVPKLEDIIGH